MYSRSPRAREMRIPVQRATRPRQTVSEVPLQYVCGHKQRIPHRSERRGIAEIQVAEGLDVHTPCEGSRHDVDSPGYGKGIVPATWPPRSRPVPPFSDQLDVNGPGSRIRRRPILPFDHRGCPSNPMSFACRSVNPVRATETLRAFTTAVPTIPGKAARRPAITVPATRPCLFAVVPRGT